MKYFFAVSLLCGGILAIYFLLQFFWRKEKKYIENRLVAVCSFSSAIWSMGFGVLILQTDETWAYYCRAFGMIGVFLYLISVQMLVCHISGINKKWRYFLEGFSFTGVIIYFLTIQRSEVVYYPSEMGMTYYFKKGFCNNVYTAYSVIEAIIILGVIIYMIRSSKVKRMQVFGKWFLLVEFIVVFGMILDTIFPLIGKNAIPGSSLTQFWGLVVLYYAVSVINRSRINITNMSEFIYYSLAIPVLVYDVDRKLQIVNDAAASFLEIGREDIGSEYVRLDKIFEIKEEEVFSFQEKRKDVDAVYQKGQVYCSLAVSKISDSYGDIIGYIVIITDLSERMKAMQELEKAMKAAETANQAKSTFLANMSHEIRTPMNAIIGFSELILKMELNQKTREYVEDIKSSAGNLLAIINDILDFSKIESGKMELISKEYYTAALFHDIYLIIHTQAQKKGLEFRMKVDPDMPNKLFGDSVRIRGVLINLLNNALKYTNEGTVSFEAEVKERNEDTVVLEFRVADTGIGIRPEDQNRLFESFSRADMKLNYSVEGTGLGLAIAKGYVTLMEGEITVESTYGQGSVFTVTIRQKMIDESPLDQSYAEGNITVEDSGIGNMKISGVRVLVVDDNQVNRKVADNSLSYYGLTVDTASSGPEAIELCRTNQYQIVFMDQMMPQMDGIEAMQQIRKLGSCYAAGGRSKIVVLTANAIVGVREDLLEQGFDEYLGKPMNFKELEQLFLRFIPSDKIHNHGEIENNHLPEGTDKQELDELQAMLPEVEISSGLRNCRGLLQDYLSILKMIYRDGETQLEELRNLNQKQEYSDYTIRIHALKGTALNIGANKISEMARRQEQAGKEKDYSYIAVHAEEFQQEYRRLLERIAMVLERYQLLEDISKQMEKKQLKEPEILQILKEAEQSIGEFDFAKAVNIIREARKHPVPEPYIEVLAQMEQWINEMELEKIQELLNALKET